jgi:hypothetical protein
MPTIQGEQILADSHIEGNLQDNLKRQLSGHTLPPYDSKTAWKGTPIPYVPFVDPRKDLGSGVGGFMPKLLGEWRNYSIVEALNTTVNTTNSSTGISTVYEVSNAVYSHGMRLEYDRFMFRDKSLIFELSKDPQYFEEKFTDIKNADGNVTLYTQRELIKPDYDNATLSCVMDHPKYVLENSATGV